MTRDTHTHRAAEWLAALEAAGGPLRRTGAGAWNGPCPLCGGRDRFHLREREGGALVGCRQCIDGQPSGRARFGELVRLLWPDPRENRARNTPESANPTPPPGRGIHRALPEGHRGRPESPASVGGQRGPGTRDRTQ